MRDISGIDLRLVQTFQDAMDLKSWLGERREFLGVDTETTGLNAGTDKVRLCQFGDATMGWSVPWQAEDGGWAGFCKEIIEGYRGKMVSHNLLFDSKMLLKAGVRYPQQYAHDTMIMAHLDNPMRNNRLKPLSRKLVHPAAAAIGEGVLDQAFSGGGWGWGSIPIDHPAYWTYSAFDTSLCAIIAEELYPKIKSKFNEQYEIELACIHVLRDCEVRGMRIDPGYIYRAIAKLERELAVMAAEIPVDANSDKQVVDYLLSIGVPLFHRTDKGNLSTNGDVLKYHAPDFPICSVIAEFRSKDRMRGSYLEKFVALHAEDQGWWSLHCNIHPVGARTGRMSVTEPPLQTLPRGKLVRDAFIPEEDCDLLSADFAGMEMRVMASDADEQAMIEAFLAGHGIHEFTAAAVYGEDYTKKQRQTAKNSGFAKIYGAGVAQFAATAGISIEEATSFLNRYDELFPGVARWQQRITEGVMRTAGRGRIGYVQTVGGRMLPVPKDEAYKACNYRIQGSCGEILKRKIAELDAAGVGEFMRLPVHDELVFNTPRELTEEVRHTIHDVMADRETFAVDLPVDSDVMFRWGDKYPENEFPSYLTQEEMYA